MEVRRFSVKLFVNEISKEYKPIPRKMGGTGNRSECRAKAVCPGNNPLCGGHVVKIGTGRNLEPIGVPASNLDLCQVKRWPMLYYLQRTQFKKISNSVFKIH